MGMVMATELKRKLDPTLALDSPALVVKALELRPVRAGLGPRRCRLRRSEVIRSSNHGENLIDLI